jgi:hypothetical protein
LVTRAKEIDGKAGRQIMFPSNFKAGRRTYPIALVLLLLVAACKPDENPTNGEATDTHVVTPIETATSNPSPSPTFTPTATPDLRIIARKSQDLLLALNDLPSEGRYFAYDSSPLLTNPELIAQLGVEGQAQIDETGRIEGWWITYSRGSNKFSRPLNISNYASKFQSPQGAKIYVDKYERKYDIDHGYNIITEVPVVGDFSFETSRNSDAIPGYVNYEVEFVYRNYVEILNGYGRESVVKPEFLRQLADILLTHLKDEPLSTPAP